jgi:hypothetical protein
MTVGDAGLCQRHPGPCSQRTDEARRVTRNSQTCQLRHPSNAIHRARRSSAPSGKRRSAEAMLMLMRLGGSNRYEIGMMHRSRHTPGKKNRREGDFL